MKPSEYWRVDRERYQIEITVESGFFALCTHTLLALTQCYPSETYFTVNWPRQNQWRNNDQIGKNLFELYFHPNPAVDLHSLAKVHPTHQSLVYEDLDFEKLNPYIQNYFLPSEIVRAKQEELLRKYNIEYENTIGLCYRGTDKWLEIAQIQPEYYVQEVKRLVAQDPELKVLIQTDQLQIRDRFVRVLGERAFFLSELPVSSSPIGIHAMSESERGISNFELGIRLLAAVTILAKCKYTITHTGSIGLWTYLFRGTPRNGCQLKPGPPDVYSSFEGEMRLRRRILKKARKLINN
jgi:hypothetical protein